MRIAIPVGGKRLSLHFGHSDGFALIDVDETTKKITGEQWAASPPHEPGVLPAWLVGQGVDVVLAGGMGARAQTLFAEHGLTVVTGAPVDAPKALVEAWMNQALETGANYCDH